MPRAAGFKREEEQPSGQFTTRISVPRLKSGKNPRTAVDAGFGGGMNRAWVGTSGSG
jgi:hypothetical protein